MILAIDPGSSQSAWVALRDGLPERFALVPNDVLLGDLRVGIDTGRPDDPILLGSMDVVVIEWTAPRGMPASAELFETLYWVGRFAEAAEGWCAVWRLPRGEVKRALCGTTAAKDSNVRAALIDRYGGAGGKAAAVGVKASPGPLYGIRADIWQALAVAVAWSDRL